MADNFARRLGGRFAENFANPRIIQHFILLIEKFGIAIRHEENGIARLQRRFLLRIVKRVRSSQRHAFQQYFFNRAGAGAVNQDGRHTGRGHGHAVLVDSREQHGHVQIPEMHAFDDFAAFLEEASQIKIIAKSVKQAFDRSHQRAGPHTVSGGITKGHGQRAILINEEIIIIATHFRGGSCLHRNVEMRERGDFFGQHRELKLARLFQFLSFARIVGFEQSFRDFFFAGAAFLYQRFRAQFLDLPELLFQILVRGREIM